MHKAAKGQDLGQSGRAGFSCGHGIPSDMDAMSSIAPAGEAAIATDGAASGTIRRLTTARIESRRGKTGQSFTLVVSHMLQCKKRPDRSRCRQNAEANGHSYSLRPMFHEQMRGHDRGCDERFQPIVGGQPAGIADAKLLGRPPASQPDKDFLNLSFSWQMLRKTPEGARCAAHCRSISNESPNSWVR